MNGGTAAALIAPVIVFPSLERRPIVIEFLREMNCTLGYLTLIQLLNKKFVLIEMGFLFFQSVF